jgi:ribosomal protein S18 acetylase RimI-like enzyme
MPSVPPTPRRAVEADVPALSRALARAFHDDPVACWSSPRETGRLRMLERFHGARLRQALREQEVWTSPGLEGAALWLPPGCWRSTPREDLELARCMVTPRLVWRMPLVFAGFLRGIERHHPAEQPHWYLAVLGTEPAAQGRGIGSALLSPVLSRCDADGVGAYLESSKERNIAFYARHGFRVTRELRLPRGPSMWAMWREPRP